jgi:hypothetical protein
MLEGLLVAGDYVEVVHVTAIVLAVQVPFSILVELVHIYVGEELGGDVADGQAHTGRGVLEEFLRRDVGEVGFRPDYDAVFEGVAENDEIY